jgi:hypothetical protein
MNNYDSWIDTYQITPPIGGVFVWGAKANVKKIGTGRIDDIITLSEHLGQSRAEANDKARQEAISWIEARTKDGK